MNKTLKLFNYSLIFAFLISIVATSNDLFGQQVKLEPFKIQPSNFANNLNKFATENANATTEEIIKKANELINEVGVNFSFEFDEATCKKIKAFQEKKENVGKPITLSAVLNSTEGDKSRVVLPPVRFPQNNCGKCFIEMPVLEITQKTFITKIRGLNVKFDLPRNFFVNNVALVDEKNVNDIKKSWIIPQRKEPLSISSDNSILYFDYPLLNNKDILLIFYDTGVFQFYKKSDLDIAPKSKSKDITNIIKITDKKAVKLLKYIEPCK